MGRSQCVHAHKVVPTVRFVITPDMYALLAFIHPTKHHTHNKYCVPLSLFEFNPSQKKLESAHPFPCSENPMAPNTSVDGRRSPSPFRADENKQLT